VPGRASRYGLPPLPEYDAFLFFKQWLAELNLGLASVAAAIRSTGRSRLARSSADASMLVVTSAPVGRRYNVSSAAGDGMDIEEGWLLARTRIQAPIEEPYGREPSRRSSRCDPDGLRRRKHRRHSGRALLIRRRSRTWRVISITYGRGTFSVARRGTSVTLVEADVLGPIELLGAGSSYIVTRGSP